MSLLCRLKNLVHKGLLKKEELDRIIIIPKEPSDDMVSRGVFEQLEKLGYVLGQKIEPCEDCISRNKVLEGKVIHQSCDGVEIIDSYAVPVEYIEQLPSIQPKTGRWKLVQRNNFIDICCSECGHVRVEDFAYGYTIQQLDKESVKEFFSKNPLNFCECCGVKMIKSQESENNE